MCWKHGGAAPQVRAAAERRLLTQAVEADAEAILAHRGLAGVDDPYSTLSHLAAELMAHKDAWSARVNALTTISTRSVQNVESVRVEIAEYGKAMALAARTLEVLARLQLDDRRVRITEAIGDQVTAAIREILAGLALTPAQEAVAPAVVSQAMLRLVAS